MLALRAEHHAVDHKGVLVAEELREAYCPVMSLEHIVFGDFAARGKGATQGGDPLNVPSDQSPRRGGRCDPGDIRDSRWGSELCSSPGVQLRGLRGHCRRLSSPLTRGTRASILASRGQAVTGLCGKVVLGESCQTHR